MAPPARPRPPPPGRHAAGAAEAVLTPSPPPSGPAVPEGADPLALARPGRPPAGQGAGRRAGPLAEGRRHRSADRPIQPVRGRRARPGPRVGPPGRPAARVRRADLRAAAARQRAGGESARGRRPGGDRRGPSRWASRPRPDHARGRLSCPHRFAEARDCAVNPRRAARDVRPHGAWRIAMNRDQGQPLDDNPGRAGSAATGREKKVAPLRDHIDGRKSRPGRVRPTRTGRARRSRHPHHADARARHLACSRSAARSSTGTSAPRPVPGSPSRACSCWTRAGRMPSSSCGPRWAPIGSPSRAAPRRARTWGRSCSSPRGGGRPRPCWCRSAPEAARAVLSLSTPGCMVVSDGVTVIGVEADMPAPITVAEGTTSGRRRVGPGRPRRPRPPRPSESDVPR